MKSQKVDDKFLDGKLLDDKLLGLAGKYFPRPGPAERKSPSRRAGLAGLGRARPGRDGGTSTRSEAEILEPYDFQSTSTRSEAGIGRPDGRRRRPSRKFYSTVRSEINSFHSSIKSGRRSEKTLFTNNLNQNVLSTIKSGIRQKEHFQ